MNENQSLIDGLRHAADFLEVNDGVGKVFGEFTLSIHCKNADEMIHRTRGLGRLDKVTFSEYFLLRKILRPGMVIDWWVDREKVCERIVTKETLPALPERTLPAEPERVVEKVTWSCPESLLGKRRDLQASADAWAEPRVTESVNVETEYTADF